MHRSEFRRVVRIAGDHVGGEVGIVVDGVRRLVADGGELWRGRRCGDTLDVGFLLEEAVREGVAAPLLLGGRPEALGDGRFLADPDASLRLRLFEGGGVVLDGES